MFPADHPIPSGAKMAAENPSVEPNKHSNGVRAFESAYAMSEKSKLKERSSW
jgi:hypothetical protein